MSVNIDATFELPHSYEAIKELREWRQRKRVRGFLCKDSNLSALGLLISNKLQWDLAGMLAG